MQDISDFLATLPKSEQLITQKLHSIILGCDPRIWEKFSYGVPYFSKKRRIAFLWPASAPLGPKDGSVSFGLCYGNRLSNSQGLLKLDGRKQVAITRFAALSEIDQRVVEEIIQEALIVDDLPL